MRSIEKMKRILLLGLVWVMMASFAPVGFLSNAAAVNDSTSMETGEELFIFLAKDKTYL